MTNIIWSQRKPLILNHAQQHELQARNQRQLNQIPRECNTSIYDEQNFSLFVIFEVCDVNSRIK